jgi:hypothetical protein
MFFVMDVKNEILIGILILIRTTKQIETVDQPYKFLLIYMPLLSDE